MALRTDRHVWGALTRALHWISAVVLIGGFAHAWWMTHLLEPRQARLPHYILHSTIFLYFALLLALRFVWRLADGRPDDPPSSTPLERMAAHAGHLALYAAMIAAVVTGYMNWSAFPARFDAARAAATKITVFGFDVPGLHAERTSVVLFSRDVWEHTHEFLANAMMVLVVVHVLAALRHSLVKKNDVMSRMTTGRASSSVS